MNEVKHKSERQLHPRTIKMQLGWSTPKGVPSYSALVDEAAKKYWDNRR